MLDAGDYGFAVLSDDKKKCDAITGELRKGKNDATPLLDQVPIITAVVPTSETIQSWDLNAK